MAFPKFFHYIFVTAPVHFIHHSILLKEGNSNYGTIFSFWDIIFGTFTDPNKREKPISEVGIENDPVPSSFFKQLVFPFMWNGKY
jgi:sterol desaturase/sphingolipid hydroxylase (fatty acid hydroxylase superfamily)